MLAFVKMATINIDLTVSCCLETFSWHIYFRFMCYGSPSLWMYVRTYVENYSILTDKWLFFFWRITDRFKKYTVNHPNTLILGMSFLSCLYVFVLCRAISKRKISPEKRFCKKRFWQSSSRQNSQIWKDAFRAIVELKLPQDIISMQGEILMW